MKKVLGIVFMAMIFVSLNAFSQGFTVKGSIDGVEDGKVTLQKRGGEKFKTGLQDGKFTLKGKIAEPGMFTLSVEGVRGGVPLFLQNTEFSVKAKKVNNGRADVLQAEEVKGGAAHDRYEAYREYSAKLNEVFREESKDYMEAYRAKDEAKQKKFESAYNAAYEKMQEGTYTWIKENSDCVVAAYLLQNQAYRIDDPAVLSGMIDNFKGMVAETSYVKTLKETLEIKQKTAVGVMAPDFTQNDPDGNPISLSDFKGKYVLIDFWASWCGPCRAENPNVVEAFNKFNKKGFTVLGVSLDNPGAKDKWLKAIEDDKLDWPQVSDLKGWKNEVAGQYGIRSIPSNLLVDKTGKIVAKNLRGADLHTALKKHLK